MWKKLFAALIILVLAGGAALYFWAHAILASETVRTAIASQLTRAIGQPVHIGRIGASILPRVAMTLGEVTIGEPARITVADLHVDTNVRALLSRRIEHATVRLDGARIELPLPAFTFTSSSADATPASAPVTLVSIDDIALHDVDIVSGGRTLHGDVDLTAHGRTLTIRRAALSADGTALDLTGTIDDMDAPSGELTVKAGSLDVGQLLAFVGDFANGAAPASAGTSAPATAATSAPAASPAGETHPKMNLLVALNAGKASFGTLVVEGVAGRARITADSAALEPITFGVFGGHYNGALALSLGATPAFHLHATMNGIDLTSLSTFVGHPGVLTGTLAGRLTVDGHGETAVDVIRTAAGTATIDARNGSVKGLGLVRGLVLATSMRGDSKADLGSTTADEPFTRLGGTLALAGGAATTNDLRFESKDVLLSATGTIRLDGSRVDLAGPVQLSDALSKQAGRDLLRYTASDGRVTLPATITGSADDLHVGVDLTSLAKRAIINRTGEEVKKALGDLLGKDK
jgi:uncharacterized protein involved in outer membrane biogenesis